MNEHVAISTNSPPAFKFVLVNFTELVTQYITDAEDHGHVYLSYRTMASTIATAIGAKRKASRHSCSTHHTSSQGLTLSQSTSLGKIVHDIARSGRLEPVNKKIWILVKNKP